MLKWSVMARREADNKADPSRRSASAIATAHVDSATPPRTKIKRRRSSTGRRRSNTSQRSSMLARNSLDKENQFTSTPIKSFDDHHQLDVLRDVSNLTPKDTANRRVLSAKKCKRQAETMIVHDDSAMMPDASRKPNNNKKKKDCVNPSHSQEFFFNSDNYSCSSSKNFFRPFETVDSHIKGVLMAPDACGCDKELPVSESLINNSEMRLKRRIQDTYAPTLPTCAMEYSPCLAMRTADFRGLPLVDDANSVRMTPLGKFMRNDFDDKIHPYKKPKIDHVNDFLHQISLITTLEDDGLKFPTASVFKSTANSSSYENNESKVSPLVKKFIDLRFNKISSNNSSKNNSSLINELSLDKIVDAILDTSNDSSESAATNIRKMDNNNTIISFDAETIQLLQHQNELNETQEENLINTEHERHHQTFTANGMSFDRCSYDSGFRSSPTEYSHQLDDNFLCKCSKHVNARPSGSGGDILLCNRTIINIDETFNERCVDEELNRSRKRASSTPYDYDQHSKRLYLDKSEDDNINFTLKRQRCIRRRRIEEDKKKSATKEATTTASVTENQQRLSPAECHDDRFALHNDHLLNDDSFDSYTAEAFAVTNKSTPIREIKQTTATDETLIVKTPADVSSRRFRRCLLFESPTSLSDSASTTACSLAEVRGSMDLNIYVNKDDNELIVNVIRCKDLCRPHGKQINAYVKVALGDRLGDNRRKRNGALLQRTAVQGGSSKPFFNHTFKFRLEDNLLKRLHIEVWHRDRTSRTSEFLGCMSFDVKHVHSSKKETSGSYRLLPQSTGRDQNIPITQDNGFEICKIERETIGLGDDHRPPIIMCESQSSVDEIMSLDELEHDLKKTTSKTVLSEQQKYADENIFLRYLELDPTEGPDAIPAATQRKATGNRNGRTPFTHTKKLARGSKAGFGFSVVWTHPPRIERVEKGLPADKAGIFPGDYIIFVDKVNVVMMPEIEILNLIRSFGNQLTLEIFRRNASRNGSVPSVRRLNSTGTCSTTGLPVSSGLMQRRPSTVCSTNTASVDYNRRKLHLPQVTFSAEKPSSNQDENRKKTMYQLVHKEQQYATGLQFAVTRFVSALAERQDLITPAEHRILFQNVEEILRITEDTLDSLVQDDGEPHIHLLIRTYHSKLIEFTSAYKRYCSGIKKADCVLANKTKNSNSDFCRFLQTPSIPRRRPDITTFIHKPLEHYREVLKLLSVIQSNTKSNSEDASIMSQVIHDLQLTYREITVDAGLMEPVGEGRPLLTVQDLENRLVFTKCKPFVLNKPGRQWIFGGDLGRVEGRTVRQYWTLLFSDLLLFAKVSRDRVLFIIEDPLPLTHVTDMFFNVRKKDSEFRITVSPEGPNATSPTVHCGPDLTRTPRKSASKRTIVLRAPNAELKAVWQNLLQRQIFHINAGMDGSSLSSPLESPDAPITSSVVTLQSAESLSFRRQVRLSSGHCNEPVDNSCLPAQFCPALHYGPPLPVQASLTKTPDTPSANISPASSSPDHSQAFTSHFTSESSLLPKYQMPEEPQSPSAILTPSTDISSDADAQNSEDIDFLKFDEDPWDIANFNYDMSSLNIDGMSTNSCQSN